MRCDYDFKLYFATPGGGGANIWEWNPYKTQFLEVAQGLAPSDIYGVEHFKANPISDAELEALARPSDKLVEFPAAYDTVTRQELTVR